MSRWTAFWARWRGADGLPAAAAARRMARSAGARVCAHCADVRNDPADLEAALPGLAVLGSGFGSARGDDGLCLKHDRFVTMGSSCDGFRDRACVG